MYRTISTFVLLIFVTTVFAEKTSLLNGEQTRERSFTLSYSASLVDLPSDAAVRVWLPIAQTNEQQDVTVSEVRLPKGVKQEFTVDKKYGNKILYVAYQSRDETTISVEYSVLRREARFGKSKSELSDVQRKLFLAANRKVPLSGKPTKLITNKTFANEPTKAGRQLYDLVEQYMKYDKSKPGYGHGDVLWACDSRTGNCTDFHSLFISLARQKQIPARFEIGFPLPRETKGQIKGYHCWAWFYADGNGWVPVDISEADKHPEMRDYYFGNLTADRVAFSTGRDIQLEPKPASTEPLNYFVFPFVEVDGKVWPKEKIKLDFSFVDAKNTRKLR